MPLSNLNNTHLTAAQLNALNTALTALEAAMSILDIQLTPEERKKYGTIKEQNKLLVNKVKEFNDTQPALSDPFISWSEFNADHASRQQKEIMINRLNALVKRLKNSKILHDYDSYHVALTDYAYTSLMASRGNPAFETKHSELRQFFYRTGKKNKPKTPPSDQ